MYSATVAGREVISISRFHNWILVIKSKQLLQQKLRSEPFDFTFRLHSGNAYLHDEILARGRNATLEMCAFGHTHLKIQFYPSKIVSMKMVQWIRIFDLKILKSPHFDLQTLFTMIRRELRIRKARLYLFFLFFMPFSSVFSLMCEGTIPHLHLWTKKSRKPRRWLDFSVSEPSFSG